MHAVAGEGVEVGGQRLGYGLALARLHLGYAALMQHYAAQKLYVVMPLAYGALCGLADYGECLRQQVILGLARSSLSVRASMPPSSSFIFFTMGMSFLTCASEVLPSSLSKNPIIFLHKPGKRALYL